MKFLRHTYTKKKEKKKRKKITTILKFESN